MPRHSVTSSSAQPLRRWVDVQQRPTVVRLEHLDQQDSEWITECYHFTPDVARHLAALRIAFSKPTGCGVFLIGQYGSGKSHFLAYLMEELRANAGKDSGPEVIGLSLVNFRATVALEDIVRSALGWTTQSQDRRDDWAPLATRFPSGVVLLIDELSEFLQSKADPRSYNEDIRFLQFLGEWAQGTRFWVVAAMQEEIEHTGDLEHGIYRKIKDRFPLRCLLTPAHVRELIADSILVKHRGYDDKTSRLIDELKQAFPESSIDYGQLATIYPLHPATLEILEEVRDRFSQARGIVDFTVARLGGDPTRGIEPFLDQPWGDLLSPDVVVDHFEDLFELQPEFQPVSQQLFPYYRKHMKEMFPRKPLQRLAWRLLKMLVLVHLSPSRRGLTVDEAVDWLQYRITRLQPEKNVQVVRDTLEQLAATGRYVIRDAGHFSLRLDDDGGVGLERFLQRQRADLETRPQSVLETIASLVSSEAFHPFGLPRDTWQQRIVRWHFHPRSYGLFVGNELPPVRKENSLDRTTLVVRLPWGKAEPAPGHHTLIPARIEMGAEHLELAALAAARERPWDGDVSYKLDARFQERRGVFENELRAAYLQAVVVMPSGDRLPIPAMRSPGMFVTWIEQIAQWILKRTYPSFEAFAPTHGPLPKEAFRAFMRFAMQCDLGEPTEEPYVQLIREAYLVPMKLLRRQGRGYVVPKYPDRNELVRAMRALVDCQPTPQVVAEHLAQPVYGLVPDQVTLLLIVLSLLGEVDIVKDRKSYRDCFETLPLPIQYDRIVPGTALGASQLRQLATVCDQLGVRKPGAWTVLAQRQVAGQLREVGRTKGQPLEKLLLKLRDLGQANTLCEKLQQVLVPWKALEQSGDPLDALQQFLYEIDTSSVASLIELERLPAKTDQLLSELQRFQHLLAHPAVTNAQRVALQIDTLGAAPPLEQLEHVEQWIESARRLYDHYRKDYERQHAAWWNRCAKHPLWTWQPSPLALSRHVALQRELTELEDCRRQASERRCRGQVNLDFQPVCHCQFNAGSSPIVESFERFDKLNDAIDRGVKHFFGQQTVRDRLGKWVREEPEHCGLRINRATRDYLAGDASIPEVIDLKRLDDCLGDVELVTQVDPAELMPLLTSRSWDRGEVIEAIDAWLVHFGNGRLRFSHANRNGELSRWCLQQALRNGMALPAGLSAASLLEAADAMQPEWIGNAALTRLEELGVGDAAVDRILSWVIDGLVSPFGGVALSCRDVATGLGTDKEGNNEEHDLPRQVRGDRLQHEVNAGLPIHTPTTHPTAVSPLVWAAAELCRPTPLETPEQLAYAARHLYQAHARLFSVAGSRWLEHLDQMARSWPTCSIPDLTTVLAERTDRQWVIIDCLGLPLIDMLRAELESLFPSWRLKHELFARVSAQTTTDAFYRQLLQADRQQAFEKTNCVDQVLHERDLPLADTARVAAAELRITLRAIGQRLDSQRSLLVFADHGFRLRRNGHGYTHGGDSALERIVPVLELVPRVGA